jgi:glycosyltransferase involved in cell wall biosynthesis
MGKPLLSVVVPTKDRYKYLKHLIKLIQSYNSDEWEIVVQDNTDDNTEIVEFLNELNYSGCKYYHERGQLPMTTNADKAILHSEGEFVCFLGDDDGVSPNAIEYCRLMKEKGVEALRSNLADYLWPDATSRYENIGGRLVCSKVSKNQTLLRSEDVLMDVVRRGFIDRGNLPSVYHGIVARKALDRIYVKCQTFFPGQSPDISNGIATSLIMDNFLMVDDIVTISGASKFHGGMTKGMTKQFPQITDMVWFRPGAEDIWDSRLPKIAVGSIIWAESSIETLKNMGRNDVVDTINFLTIYKYFVVYFFPLRKMAYTLVKNPLYLSIYAYIGFCKRAFNAVCRIMRNKMSIGKRGEFVVTGVDNIQKCVSVLSDR